MGHTKNLRPWALLVAPVTPVTQCPNSLSSTTTSVARWPPVTSWSQPRWWTHPPPNQWPRSLRTWQKSNGTVLGSLSTLRPPPGPGWLLVGWEPPGQPY